MRLRGLVLAAVLAVAAVAAGGTPARAAAGMEVGMEDERLLLYGGPAAEQAVRDWAALGVDVVRIHARWRIAAPGRTRLSAPRGFRQADPDDPGYDWTELDRAVALARAGGLRVELTVTGPGPLWSSRVPQRRDPAYEPDPAAFGRFASAVATRYAADVDRYLIWNEPNIPAWLSPQSACVRRRVCSPVAPHVYRDLVRAAAPAIKRADPGAQVLMGELAPIGSPARTSRTRLAPLPFLRAMACVDGAYRRLRSGLCRHFRPAAADAIGYHPHPIALRPDQSNPDPDDAQFGDLGRLFRVLDRLSAMGRLRAPHRRFDLYLTEFGYQTSPPDRGVGIPLERQTRYVQQATYLAWARPRVRQLTYYQWRDEPVMNQGPGLRYAGWQSGLNFVDGRPKPVRSTFAAPFIVLHQPGRLTARMWGQVRPDAESRVTILEKPRGSSAYQPLTEATADAQGYWSKRVEIEPGASYRFAWTPVPSLETPFPRARLSGVADLAERGPSALVAGAALDG